MRGEVNVVLTTSREVRTLNRSFRGNDEATDVLSFPPIPNQENNFAGDIVISADVARQNARRLGHTSADEVKILVLHGVLHLAGYDHENDRGEMARKEAHLRRQLRLPSSLTERATINCPSPQSSPKPRARTTSMERRTNGSRRTAAAARRRAKR